MIEVIPTDAQRNSSQHPSTAFAASQENHQSSSTPFLFSSASTNSITAPSQQPSSATNLPADASAAAGEQRSANAQSRIDTSTFKLHSKNVAPIDRAALYALPNVDPKVREDMVTTHRHLHDIALYRDNLPHRTANGCTATTVPNRFIKQLEEAGSITEIPRSRVFGWVSFFTVVEYFKERLRPIRDTVDINATWDKKSLLPIKFPSKRDVCNLVRKGTHCAAFDFSAYYDQFEYENGISEFICFRKKNKYYKTNRLCMGQRQGCQIGQTTTLFLMDFPNRRCKTAYAYIDNVIFVGSAEDVRHDSLEFLRRCRLANVTVNEMADIEKNGIDSSVVQQCDWCGIHLDFVNKTASLVEKTLTKVNISWANRHNWTYRQFAAHIGLLFWSWGIIHIPVYDFYSLLKLISAVGFKLQQAPSLWDTPAELYPSALPALEAWTALCLKNEPLVVQPPGELSWFICSDASRWGWGYRAFNYQTGEIRSHHHPWTLQQRGLINSAVRDKMLHSVYAEPLAIQQALVHLLVKNDAVNYRFIQPSRDPSVPASDIAALRLGTDSISELENGFRQAIAVATDNSSAQFTMARGFASRSYEINSSIKRLRDQFPPEKFDLEFCFVPGKMNPADKLSRGLSDANAKHGTNADIDNLRRLAGEYGHSRHPASSSIS